MAANPKPYHTLEEYFGMEKAGYARYEYWDGEIVCMSGGTKEHSRISGNLYYLLRNSIKGRNCEAFTEGQAVKNHIPSGPPYFYPDASAVCGKPEHHRLEGIDLLVNPIVLVEVISPTSEKYDKDIKPIFYQQIPSLREYLIVAQDKPEVIHYSKLDNGEWVCETIIGLEATVVLPSIGCRLSMRDIYENIEFIRQV